MNESIAMGKVIPKFHLIIITCILFSFVPSSFSATKRNTKQAEAYRDKGYQAQRLGDLNMALGLYQKAVEADPDYDVAYNDMGIVLESKGLANEAEEAYLKAISLNPNYLSAYYNLAALYQKEGETDKAAYYWRMRVNLGDWSDVWTWRAKEHLDDLKTEGKLNTKGIPAGGDLDFGLTSNPKRDAQYHLYRGRQYVAIGNYTAALKELNKAIILDPQNKEIDQSLEEAEHKILLYK